MLIAIPVLFSALGSAAATTATVAASTKMAAVAGTVVGAAIAASSASCKRRKLKRVHSVNWSRPWKRLTRKVVLTVRGRW